MAASGKRAGQIISRGDRRWLVRWFVGRDDTTGKRKYASKTIHGTKRDAQKYLNSILRSRDLGIAIEPARITLGRYLDKWLETSAKPRVSTRTLDDYRWTLAKYIRPKLGSRRLDQIRPLEIQAVVSEMQEQGLSARTIRLARSILSSALKQAVRWGMLAANPAEHVDVPKQRRREMKALSAEQVARFRTAARGSLWEVLFDLALATGMRPSEYLALTWKDVDLKAGTLAVRRAIEETSQGVQFKETKTASSRRTIPLPPTLTRALDEHRRRQAEHAMKLGPAYDRDLELVFANEVGRPLNPRNLIQRHFKPILKQAGLPKSFRLYDLRHTCATLMLASGENIKVVAERLGHASPAMTLDVYVHVVPGQQEAATAKLEEILFEG